VRDGVELRVFPNLSNRLAWRLQFFSPIGLRAWLRQHASDFDLAHIHGHHHLPGVIAASELSRAGIPYLVAPNGTAPRIERRRLAKALFDHSVGRHVLRGARWVIAVSDAERAQLEALGIEPARIRGVPNPVDLDEFEGLPPPGPRAGEATRVLYLGQLTPAQAGGRARARRGPTAGAGVARDRGRGRRLRGAACAGSWRASA
jgi:glycosyltransferase involved in cell wall biosynthesis